VTGGGFWNRVRAIFIKEFTQMRRDRFTFAVMLGVPILQLLLFGYAINTNPRQLPTAVYAAESTPIVRSILKGLENSDYFDLVDQGNDPRQGQHLLARGDVAFVVTIPPGFTADLVAARRPQMLVETDATDPSVAANALGQADAIFANALRHDLKGPLAPLRPGPQPFELVVHRKYNPEGITQYNIVPGLLGVILTLTLVMVTGIAMTREAERGTMENLLAMPARPFEVMIGKIAPYLVVGAVQTVVILLAARFLFAVPFAGNIALLLFGLVIFVIANLAVGFTFSTIAQTQMQAMQMTVFFFLPSILLSGFMFPFRGMPGWAQAIGEILPLTHFLRVVRGVMLKGVSLADVLQPLLAMTLFTVVVSAVALLRYRRTLD
jgi:ABC-2 type transport system permease protein